MNFFDFPTSAYAWNRRLDPARRIEVIFTDVALSWPEPDPESYEAFPGRVANVLLNSAATSSISFPFVPTP